MFCSLIPLKKEDCTVYEHMNGLYKTYKGHYTLIVILLSLLTAHAQNGQAEYIVNNVSINDGLSHTYSTSIVSDDLNVKWIGTENGVNKYDGYNFEHIKPSKNFKELENENIEVLFIDSAKTLWIGTKSGGLTALDTKTGRMTNFNDILGSKDIGSRYITAISESNTGNIWVGTLQNGVYIIDPKEHEVISHFKHSSKVTAIIKGPNTTMWYIAGQDLVRYDTDTNARITKSFDDRLSDMVFDEYRNRLWFSFWWKQTDLAFYDLTTKEYGTVKTKIESENSRILSLDHQNNLWVGSWGHGLFKSDKDVGSFEQIPITKSKIERERNNYDIILDIHHDALNQIWIGTAHAGIVNLVPQDGFHNLGNEISETFLNGDFNITTVFKDSSAIYLGTLGNGVFSGGNFQNVKPMKNLFGKKIFSMYAYRGYLFVGHLLGFDVLDLNTKKVVFSDNSLSMVTAFLVVNDQTLYIGTQQKGMYKIPYKSIFTKEETPLTINSDSFHRLGINRITGIVEDTKGGIWISTYNGLYLHDKMNDRYILHTELLEESLPSTIINTLAFSGDKLWLGTPAGLVSLQYDAQAQKLESGNFLNEENGLDEDFICTIVPDSQGSLWLSTNTQIVKYNPLNETFLSYGTSEGVETTSFRARSGYNFEDEVLFFGGNDNLTYFNPKDIVAHTSTPTVYFSKLQINNTEVNSRSKSNLLETDFRHTSNLTLDHTHKFISISFSTNDYLGKLNVKYRYILEGYQDEWMNLQNKNQISLASLPAGKYVLKVTATRDNQNWGAPRELKIKVKAHPLLSLWAFLLYAVLLATAVYTYLRIKKKRLNLETDLRLLKMEKRKEYEINEAKLRFFTNISHEFRAPLTLMKGPLYELTENLELDNEVRDKVLLVERNADKLQAYINQLLDFRKIQSGHLQLNAHVSNFVAFVKEAFETFTELANKKGITYEFKSTVEELYFPFDHNLIEVALCNLVFNALKYCKKGDLVTVTIRTDDKYSILSVKDSGLGINLEEQRKLFDRFYQIKSANTSNLKGSGIGLAFTKEIVELHNGEIEVISAPKQGSEFIIRISTELDVETDDIIHTSLVPTQKPKTVVAANEITKTADATNIAEKNKILIIDDHVDILNYIEGILDSEYQVLKAENADDGRILANQEIPDLIISDIMMPGTDGIALSKELKSQINTSHIPIILLTAKSSTLSELEGLKTGANDYISKPFNPSIVKARIASLLESREKFRQFLIDKIRSNPLNDPIKKDDDQESEFIIKAIELVNQNLADSQFGIDVMVDKLHMSQSTLYRKIKSLTGLSLSGFIRMIRIKKAAELIQTTELRFNEIAYDVGFGDYNYFKTNFVKHFNCLPSEYKEKMQVR